MNPFLTLGIRHEIVNAITEMGFEKPSPIQEKAIPALLTGNDDFVGLAQTGTGKTAAFGLPLLEQIDFNEKYPQALVLCPTRELCLQIARDIKTYAKNLDGVHTVAVYGGANISEQLRQIRRGVQIVVATPGRMLDIINRKAIDFSQVRYVVLDEADEMLNMGFQEDINKILSETPDDKKTWLFSATMPQEVRRIAKKYMTNPVELTVGTKNTGNQNIEHHYFVVRARDKYPAMKRIVDFYPSIFGIVFCRTKIETQEIAEALIRDGYNADSLHGDLSQQQRDKVMKRFRDKTLQLLIATDVAARGIDVDDITHVINYSLPDEVESYTHRSGRTARAGKTGTSISIVNMKETHKIRRIEKIVGKEFIKKDIPSGVEVCENQLISIVDKIKEVNIDEEQLAPYKERIMESLSHFTKEDIIKKVASMEFNKFLEYYKNAPDLNANATRDSSRSSRRSESGFTRMFINVGAVDDFNRGDILGFICHNTDLSGSAIGKIDLKGTFTFFEVRDEHSQTIIDNLHGAEYNGREVRVERSNEPGRGGGGGRRSFRGNGRSGGGRRDRSYGGGSSYGNKNRRKSRVR